MTEHVAPSLMMGQLVAIVNDEMVEKLEASAPAQPDRIHVQQKRGYMIGALRSTVVPMRISTRLHDGPLDWGE
jgi:hypothetical protein